MHRRISLIESVVPLLTILDGKTVYASYKLAPSVRLTVTSVQVLIEVSSRFHGRVSSQRKDGGLSWSGIEKQYSSCFQQVGPPPRFLT